MRFVGFIGPSYQLNSVNVDCQRCINLYPEINELGTGKEREVAALVGTPGLRLLATVGDGPIRGNYTASNGRLFVVSGEELYELDSDWNATLLGALNSATGPVSMADNGIALVVVDGGDGYGFVFATDTYAEITDPDFPGADQVTYQDGYFIFNKPDSGQFFISGLNDTTFDELDIKSSEGNPDNIIGVLSDHRDLWLFNSITTEVFYNAGQSTTDEDGNPVALFPFERIQGAFIEHGCAARFSIQKMGNSVFWLGQDDKGSGMVFMAKGYQPQRISTHPVEAAIRSYAVVSDAIAYSYQENGHNFYILTFPTANATWAYDISTNMWHERAYVYQGEFQRHRANCHAFAFNTHVVGDYEDGKIYELTSAVYTDNGNEIVRRRVSPHITSSLKRVFYASFQLDMETGVGIDGVGQGTDPTAILEYSDDGGHSWSNEKWAKIGKIGQTKARAIWRRLGASRDRVFRITISDPVKTTLIGAEMTLESGAS